MASVARPAWRSKYTHHSATFPAKATASDSTVVAVGSSSANVAPVARIDSPNATMRNS